jgi:hypothetical protein
LEFVLPPAIARTLPASSMEGTWYGTAAVPSCVTCFFVWPSGLATQTFLPSM